MQYNFKKHYYDPYDSLDVAWKARISHDWLSIGEAACLSGYSRQYINRLVTNRRIIAKRDNEGKLEISWQNFVKWYSALPVTPCLQVVDNRCLNTTRPMLWHAVFWSDGSELLENTFNTKRRKMVFRSRKKSGLRFRFNHVYIHAFITSIKRTWITRRGYIFCLGK